MSRVLSLENFETGPLPSRSDGPAQPSPVADEAAVSLEAFENGYKNGWADCAAAEAEERQSVAADLAKRLSEAHLTHETARQDVLSALDPFFEELVATLLPRLLAAAVAPVAVEHLHELAESQTQGNLEILAAPGTCATLQKLVEAEGYTNVSVRAEPAFTDSQVSLRAGSERRDVNLAEAGATIAEAITAFRTQVEETHYNQGAA